MKIITVYFERKKEYRKFLKVFKKSAHVIMPKTKLEILNIEMPVNIDHKRDTAFAFLAAANYVIRQNEQITVADVDLLFVNSINDIWKEKFDIAITVRDSMKYNTGLWFYRPTNASRLFMKKWIKHTKNLMKEFCENEEFIWQYGGIDQASLHLAIEENESANILELPCQKWNATQSEWKIIDEETKIIHVKSKLRLAALGKIDIPENHKYMIPLVEKWRSYL